MPYVDDRWVPESDRERWDSEHQGDYSWERSYAPWRYRQSDPEHPVGQLRSLAPAEAKDRLLALGDDLASVLRDGWLYWNLVEQLKVADPSKPQEHLDQTAGWIVDRMELFNMQSARAPETGGGPPAPTNSRPFKGVLNYLLDKMGHVKEFLSRAAHMFMALIQRLAENTATGVSVAISTPWPTFQVGFNADVEMRPFVQDALQLFQSRLDVQVLS